MADLKFYVGYPLNIYPIDISCRLISVDIYTNLYAKNSSLRFMCYLQTRIKLYLVSTTIEVLDIIHYQFTNVHNDSWYNTKSSIR